MTLHIYKDPDLALRVSEGDMKSPDVDSYDGTLGEIKDRELFIANEQAALASDIESYVTGLFLDEPRFKDGDAIIVDEEMMRVVGGGGSTGLAVQRGYAGTLPASHSSGAIIYTACNYSNLTVQPVDLVGSDESSWCSVAATQGELETALPGQPLVIAGKQYDTTVSFWRRFSIAPGTPIQNKTDIKLRITAIESLA